MTASQFKSMAKSLRLALAARRIPLSHSECLELVARQFGFGDWNALCAKLPSKPTPEPPLHADSTPEEPACSFCGKHRHSVRSLIEGGCTRGKRAPHACVFICDECVALCAEVNADAAMPSPS